MLERVALNQTRFNVPGITADSRGVVLGQRGLVLLATVERLVSFFRIYGDQDSLDDLLATLRIGQVRTQLGTREFVASFGVASSYQMDRCAAIAKMLGGLAFTGSSRHFVKYRDPTSPLGYDVDRLLPTGGELALYHDDFSQVYELEREIPFKTLVLRLSPRRVVTSRRDVPEDLLLAVVSGLSGAVQGYLYRNGAEAQVAVAEWPAGSAFDDGPRRLFLFRCHRLPPRIVALMEDTPGIEVYEPLAENVAVERGYRHPIHLPSCLSVFSDGGLYLFSGSRDSVDVLGSTPPFADLRSLGGVSIDLGRALPSAGRGEPATGRLEVELRLVPTSEPWRRVAGVAIPWSRVEQLRALVYALPPRLLSGAKIHVSDERIVVLGDAGAESLPLGTVLYRFAPAVLVAAGYGFLPQVPPELLVEILGAVPGETFVFEPGDAAPYRILESEMAPLGRRAVAAMAVRRAPGLLPEPPERERAEIRYDELGAFPLWGLPGRRATGSEGS